MDQISKYLTQDLLPEILNRGGGGGGGGGILFFPCSIKSVRVGPKNLGSVRLLEPHIFFYFGLKEIYNDLPFYTTWQPCLTLAQNSQQ